VKENPNQFSSVFEIQIVSKLFLSAALFSAFFAQPQSSESLTSMCGYKTENDTIKRISFVTNWSLLKPCTFVYANLIASYGFGEDKRILFFVENWLLLYCCVLFSFLFLIERRKMMS
jgi:hypothetical protein